MERHKAGFNSIDEYIARQVEFRHLGMNYQFMKAERVP